MTIRTLTSDKKKTKLKCHQKITHRELWEVQGEGASVSAPGRTGEGFAEERRDQQGLGDRWGCHRGAEVGGMACGAEGAAWAVAWKGKGSWQAQESRLVYVEPRQHGCRRNSEHGVRGTLVLHAGCRGGTVFPGQWGAMEYLRARE